MTVRVSRKLKNLSINNFLPYVLEQSVLEVSELRNVRMNYTTKVALAGTCDL